MMVMIRLLRSFHSRIVADLERNHSFAYERVGWIFAKQATASAERLLLFPVEYRAVVDEDYVMDDSVGACFNTASIRSALQRCRDTGMSCLQVHLHDHEGRPNFSQIDIRTIDKLAPSFCAMAASVGHGGLVLSRDSATARVWLPGGEALAKSRVTVVGFPMHFDREAL
jgi:hypothetical protein